MLLSKLSRGPRTLLVGVMLLAAYAGYARLMTPWLSVERPEQKLSPGHVSTSRSVDVSRLSSRWFPEDPWVATAGKRFRDGQRFLFFNQFKLSEDNRTMQVKPVAMLWQAEDDEEQPITVSAASAKLDRSSSSSLTEGEFGRIIGGQLDGDVYIRGPDGLRITGRNFFVSESAMMIWTSHPVNFAWQNHTGRAQDGLEIRLLASPDNEDGLTSITDIQSIRLNGRVTCDLLLESRKRPQDQTRLNINAANGLVYNVATRTAVFSGYEDRKPIPENQILVQRPNEVGSIDKLICTQLTLQLKPRLNVSAVAKSGSQRMELHSILAEGSRVVVRLEEHNVTATMTSLRYVIDQSMLELWHNKADDSGRPYPVEIRQNGSAVYAPHILVLHGQGNQIHSMECHGPGIIQHRENADDEAIEAVWTKSLQYRQDPEPKISIEGNVQISQAARELRLSGQQLEMTLHEEAHDASARSQNADDAQQPSLDFARLKPRLLIVRDNVRLTGPQLTGVAREQLTARFTTAQDGGSINIGDQSSAVTPAASTTVDAPAVDQSSFTHFESDTMEATIASAVQSADDTGARVAFDSRRKNARQADFSDVWLKGSVKVEHTAVDPERSFSAAGNILQAKNGFEQGRDINLFGDPASIVSTTRRVEGQRIELSELQREFRVEGSGRIRIVIDSLFGQPLEKPSPLDVYWSQKMHFSGRTANFVGNIRGVMKDSQSHDVEMTCAGMQIHFVRDVALPRDTSLNDGKLLQVSSAQPKQESDNATDIERIECQSLVNVSISQLIGGVESARHLARFTDLVVNVRTGDFEAVGPGRLESTQPDHGNKLKFSPGVVVRSNAPVRASENPFVFVSADFIGSVSGNMNREVVRLNHHVVGVFGPVRRLGEKIDVNGVNTADLPPQAGVLRCEQLTVSSIPGSLPGERSFSLQADNKARMELKEFSGEADHITYDHAKRQYILSSEQDRMATVSHRPGVGMDVRRFVGQKFQYYPPPRNMLKADQIIGLDGAFDSGTN